MNLETVLDEVIAALHESRRAARQREQAYIALAQAILADEAFEPSAPQEAA